MKNHFIMQKIKRYVQEKEEISMQIKCDKCSAVSESIMPETYLEGDIEFTFFRCPECGGSTRCAQRTLLYVRTLRNTPGCGI